MGKRSFADEIRDVARGWRWGHRPIPPADAESSTEPAKRWEFPTDWARTETGRLARDALLSGVMGPIVFTQTSPEVFGLENLEPLRPPVMFISNHSSHLDATLILTTLPPKWRNRTATAAAKDYFFDVWWRSAFTALVYGGFPIERGGGEKATAKAKELIREGWNLIVFPEGTRSPDGWMQRFRHGTAKLAIDMDMPVMPIGIVGASVAMPKGRNWPKPGRPPIRVRYGEALRPAEGESHQELSLRMQQAIAELFDEDRSSWWEARRRSAAGSTPRMSGPTGPRWLRTWEGSRPVRRTGRPPTWR
ncbi:MAG: lysophospholipid acyltransferase family protein [Actinomycetota bacterium]